VRAGPGCGRSSHRKREIGLALDMLWCDVLA